MNHKSIRGSIEKKVSAIITNDINNEIIRAVEEKEVHLSKKDINYFIIEVEGTFALIHVSEGTYTGHYMVFVQPKDVPQPD